MAAQELPSPRSDPTARAALATVERAEPRRLEVPLSEWCGEQLIEAFVRLGEAYYSGK